MSNIVRIFLVVVVFIVGLSIGMYYGISHRNDEIVETPKSVDSVQDIVIRNVQEEKKVEENSIEALSTMERVSPYAKMIIEKKYRKCGHTTIKEMDVPKELVNLTKEEIEAKYTGWDVKSFSPSEFTLFRVIDANCEDHFVLKESDGYVAVFNEVTDDVANLIEKTSIMVENLGEEEKHDLENGIEVFGKDAVESILQTLL